MGAATSWTELALNDAYLAGVAIKRGIPSSAIDDVVGAAVLDLLEREAKGQRFPGQAIAAKGAIGSAVRAAVRLAAPIEHEPSNRPTADPEDEETAAQMAEWRGLSERERLRRAQESWAALGTSLSPVTSGYGNTIRPPR